jgi:hypothetical protein
VMVTLFSVTCFIFNFFGIRSPLWFRHPAGIT